ncbi:hypothetical protein Tco_0968763 [Tanacetum coccineum]
MAPNRSKSFYAIKECSTCGSWYTKECCSIGNLNDQIIVPVPNSSLHCAVCGTPVDGPYCHGCTLIRMKFEKDLFTYCVDNGVFQNFQDTSESSNDNTNVVNAPREPSVVDQDPGILNEIQPLKQETLNQIQKDQEEKSIAELLAEERLQKANQALNESQSPQELSNLRFGDSDSNSESLKLVVDDDDSDDDVDYEDDVYDCVDIVEAGGDDLISSFLRR